ncbi:ribosomal protein S18-alanine N-acetyltransferase [Vibrio methylphosphonaticus]|uniref:ribosomal protein S18-alanine N-acetyltransferase n=1 Tax=Vibrio methylphosphonaticus TaxID=2946866 RepID=UPI00202AACED|nr:ribosomal protein S18-alanine N-acetyltransferase [Vibrio methylphosphonaticus]MCL9773330.1 ribosomal protein S18-alanine N-acetyltransferase [Vibrio methylphosphonaticus]
MRNFEFAPLAKEHVTAVLAIELQAHSHPWKASMIEEINGRGAQNSVMLVDGQVVGYFYAQNIVGEVSLLNIAIDPNHQRKGFGRALLAHFLDQCQSCEAESAWLEVRESNQSAMKLYLDEGFNEVDRRKAYYPTEGGREDGIIMSYYFMFGMQ